MFSASPIMTLVAAGAINAGFALPMKFLRKWAWENIWLVWAVFALLVFPISLGCFVIPGFLTLVLTPSGPLIKVALFGALWGVGQVLFGFALEEIGISLATAVMLGVSIVIGTIVPLVVVNGGHLPVVRVATLIAGVSLALAGVALCAHAGRNRGPERGDARRGIAYAFAAGAGAGLFNFSMVFGETLVQKALQAGSTPALAQLAAWTPFLLAGALANVGYCALRLACRGTYSKFTERGTVSYWFRGLLMAALWLGSALLYGVSVTEMGRWGAVFAWPVYMSLIILGTAVVGTMIGEWRFASRLAVFTMSGGLAILCSAVFLISCVYRDS
jgi:L-rhamnose-H+ transport protein